MPLTRARLRISDYNETRKGRLKKTERSVRMISLSLTSMVDMFAILVIFLLVNSSTVSQWIQVGHGIVLPKAGKTDQPKKAAAVSIAVDGIYGGEKRLAKINEVGATGGAPIPQLKAWLRSAEKNDGYVNIVAHVHAPFGLVKRVVATCQEMGFSKVNLAVQPSGK